MRGVPPYDVPMLDAPQTTQLAAQLYTLRDFTKTPPDLDATFAKLADQGWKAVQVSAVGPIEPQELKRLLDKHGLACCATHVRDPKRLWDDPQGVIDEHKLLGCAYTAVGGYFPGEADATEPNWRDWISRYNEAAAHFKDSGVALGYHNHSHEFAKLGGKQALAIPRPWDLLTGGLTPDVWMEVDTYWVAHAGGDPAATIRALAGRVPCVHLKDMAITKDRQPYMAEVGVGNLNWPGVLAACRDAGTRWYIVEQDTCYRDPFDSLHTSLRNLLAMGLA